MPTDTQLNLSRYVPGQVTFLENKLATGASQCYRKHFGIGVVEWRMLSMLAVESDIADAESGGADDQSTGSQGRAALHRAIDGQR